MSSPAFKTQTLHCSLPVLLSAFGVLSSLCVSSSSAASLIPDVDLAVTTSVRETWSDNVDSAIDSLARDDLITDLNAGLTLSSEAPQLKTDIRYNFQLLHFLNNTSASTTLNQLDANFTLYGLKKRLTFTTRVSNSQQQISNQASTVTSNLTSSNNRTNVTTLTLSPAYTHPFGRYATLSANAQLSQTSIDSSATSGGSTESTNVSLRNGTAFRNLSWDLSFANNSDRGTGSESTSINAQAGYRIGPKTTISFDLGSESNQADSNQNSSRSHNWSLTADWTISRRQSLQVSYGRRIFGRNLGLNWNLRMRNGSLSANYTEDLQTINSQQSTQQVFDPLTGQVVVANNQANLGSDQFLERNLRLSANTSRGRSQYSLSASAVRRSFEVSGNNELVQDLTASWALNWTPRLTSTLATTLRRSRFDSTNRTDTFYDLNWTLGYEVRKDVNASLQLRRSQRRSDDSTAEFAANSISVSISASF